MERKYGHRGYMDSDAPKKRKNAHPRAAHARSRSVHEHRSWLAQSPARAVRIAAPCSRRDLTPPVNARGAASNYIAVSNACISTRMRASSAHNPSPSISRKKTPATNVLSTPSVRPSKRTRLLYRRPRLRGVPGPRPIVRTMPARPSMISSRSSAEGACQPILY